MISEPTSSVFKAFRLQGGEKENENSRNAVERCFNFTEKTLV